MSERSLNDMMKRFGVDANFREIILAAANREHMADLLFEAGFDISSEGLDQVQHFVKNHPLRID